MKKFICRLLIVSSLAGALYAMSGCTTNSNPYGSNNSEGTIFESGTVAPGGAFTHVFTTAGVIPYHCKFHGSAGGGGMSGTITVRAGGMPSLDTVFMNYMTFSPAQDTVDVGDTVKWVNIGSINHTATSDK